MKTFALSILTVLLCCLTSSSQEHGSLSRSMNSATRSPDGTVHVGPDAKDRSELFSLLEDEQVQAELALEEPQIDAILRISQEHNEEVIALYQQAREQGSLPREEYQLLKASHKKRYEDSIEELLLPEQTKRLENIVYRMEVARIGFAEAFTRGLLSRDVGIYDGQKDALYRTMKSIEDETLAKIRDLIQNAEEEVLKELPLEQRTKAKELLGSFFEYKYETPQQSAEKLVEGQVRPSSSRSVRSLNSDIER